MNTNRNTNHQYKEVVMGYIFLGVIAALMLAWTVIVTVFQERAMQEHYANQGTASTVQLEDGSWVTEEHYGAMQYAQEHPEEFV